MDTIAQNPPMSLDDALLHVQFIRDCYAATNRKLALAQAEALTMAMDALKSQMDAELRPSEHWHACGVVGCGNRYACHGRQCAGDVWTCPACELNQQDAFYTHALNTTGA